MLNGVEHPRHGLAGLDEGLARGAERLPAQHRGVVYLHLRRVRLLHQAFVVARVEVDGLSWFCRSATALSFIRGFFFFLPFPISSLSRREGQWGTSRGHWELYHAVYRIGDVRPVQQVGLDVV